MLVVKLAGCNGSGKTTTMRGFLEAAPFQALGDVRKSVANRPVGLFDLGPDPEAKPEAYVLPKEDAERLWGIPLRVVVLGPYKTACGGMDAFGGHSLGVAAFRKYATAGSLVLFEGALLSSTYGEFGGISEEPAHEGRWLYGYMDTPFDECVNRVKSRRAERGNDTAFDENRTMSEKFYRIGRVRGNIEAKGNHMFDISHKLSGVEAAESVIDEVKRYAAAHGGY